MFFEFGIVRAEKLSPGGGLQDSGYSESELRERSLGQDLRCGVFWSGVFSKSILILLVEKRRVGNAEDSIGEAIKGLVSSLKEFR